jgi:hypothetical protein
MEPKQPGIYNIIKAGQISQLIDFVNSAIANGYAPIGGVSSVQLAPNKYTYYQAVVKRTIGGK